MAGGRALDIYRNDRMVGTLFDETPLRFRYADAWMQANDEEPIAPTIGLQQQEHTGGLVYAYFENLLPEGDLRRYLSISRHATSVFGLLSAVAGDTASGLSLLPAGEKPGPRRYLSTDWETIAKSLHDPAKAPLIAWNAEDGRISLAGAQDKMLLLLTPEGMPAIPQDSAPSTHILKPDIVRLPKVWATALNETFVMKLASKLSLETAEVSYQPIVKACLVERYDRTVNKQGELIRLHQLDLCQLAGKSSEIKYESDGGPTLAQCRELLQQNNVPARDLKRLLEWIFFNLYVGNNDSHAKNLAVLYTTNEGPRLAPFYDLMSTTMYAGLSKNFAFSIGGEFNPWKMQAAHIESTAEQLGFKKKYVFNIAARIAENLLDKIVSVTEELSSVAQSGTEKTMLHRLQQSIANNTKKLNKRWTA
ncbi:MAG: type II toxin-antitoxin system HipA family toxin [Burkholderiales bacterium]|nr:type II toxin-antitoxin system HipA family toxin [Burkholderiales bacterium]